MVVVHAPDNVAPVARDVDVLGLGGEDEGVQGEVRLQEAPVRLRLDPRKLHPLRGGAEVEPGAICATARSGSGPSSNWATICWGQVVPDLA